MAHKAEQILGAVTTALTGLTTTGSNVQRARVYEVPDGVDQALSIQMGADELLEEGNMAYIDRLLNIEVVAHAKAGTGVDTTLNQIRAEVHQALYTDRTQGLGFVINTYCNGDDAPEFSGEADSPVARQVLNYVVHYRHAVADPEL